MEELARGFDDNATDPDREESTLSQTVIDDMEDMFAQPWFQGLDFLA